MFKTLLVPVDLTQESSWRKVLPVAVDQARHQNAVLHVMTVVDINLDIIAVRLPEGFREQHLAQIEQRLATMVKQQIPDDLEVHTHVREGRTYQEILRVGDEIGAELIILASHRPSLQQYLLGSNAARVVRHAGCSVMIVRD